MRGGFTIDRDAERDKMMAQLHILYLSKFEKLNDDERKAITKYLTHLSSPFITGSPPIYSEDNQ